MAARLLAPRAVLLAAVVVYALSVGAMALERWLGGLDTDAIVAAAVSVSPAPPERAAAVEAMIRPMVTMYPVVTLVGLLITSVGLTTVFYAAFLFVQAGLTWGTVFGATIYATLAYTLGRLLLMLMLSMARRPTGQEIVQGTFLNTNVAAVLPLDSAAWLVAAGRSLDGLTLLYLYAFTAVLAESGRSKVSDKALAAVVATCFVLWIVVKVAWAMIFGR